MLFVCWFCDAEQKQFTIYEHNKNCFCELEKYTTNSYLKLGNFSEFSFMCNKIAIVYLKM